ncbi:sugar phosphate isomerase/epimerase family protein [Deinococcus cellulosilyticus]|uniref:Sugar phosphate isomerase n=1 Tax=Deinococcus cellulosilyticus (strain DSM 18568 / NBRC 106333 / KACC 11606 / 5516J-15) TaxID=1223518 RepID=A0A511NA66_DEIC1|nr:sugar phosphate isomerase/epimerase [Deinococcus cellulosilyticus]GEM49724.1 sugar phosphate isomerase [Deinococcus cellulosilyticus NBRC 106333 = KACC 11606]
MKYGLQCWTIRDELQKDYEGALRKAAEMGFQGVELFGQIPGAAHIKSVLDEVGLKVVGRHTGLDDLKNRLPELIEECKALDTQYLTCAWSKATDEQSWQYIQTVLTEAAQGLEGTGITLQYHNHDHELLEDHKGEKVFDFLLKAQGVNPELDVAWLHAGGVGPVAYMQRYSGKIPLLHLKDVKRKPEGGWQTVELGNGEVPLQQILDAAPASGVEWLLVEQDNCEGSPWDSLEQSLNYLKSQNLI